MTPVQVLFSIFGSLLGRLLALSSLKEVPAEKKAPLFTKTYFLTAFVDIILGLAITFMQFIDSKLPLTLFLVVQLSATAPIIGRGIINSLPTNTIYPGVKPRKRTGFI